MTKPKRGSNVHRGHARATLEDVASVAGVAPITVSRALRSPERVAAATRAKIDAAIKQVNYIPNLVAGSLASNRTRTVAVIIPTLANSIFTEVLQGMDDVLGPEGYQVIVGNSNYSMTEEEKLVAAFLARQVDGLVLTGSSHSERVKEMLSSHPVPVVETWSTPHAPIDMSVGFSNFEAARQMTLYLHGQGYEKIGFVSAPVRDNDRSFGRLRGYKAALEDVKLSVDTSLILESSFGLRYGSNALNTLVERHSDLRAVFFANDTLAVGALLECRRRGLEVPGRIAIAGFDNLELASEIVPSLTTVGVYRREMGRTAADLLLQSIRNEPAAEKRVDLSFGIIRRSSA